MDTFLDQLCNAKDAVVMLYVNNTPYITMELNDYCVEEYDGAYVISNDQCAVHLHTHDAVSLCEEDMSWIVESADMTMSIKIY